MSKLAGILDSFDPISLEEMDSVRLMDRTDTKYALSYRQLFELLDRIRNDYRILEINRNRMSQYRSLYFDTGNRKFYMDHHNGRLDRFKVRFRKYVDSNLVFLEIKRKYKGRTNKERIRRDDIGTVLSSDSRSFIAAAVGEDLDLQPTLWNQFSRITLVHKTLPERMTLDLELTYEWDTWAYTEKDLVIAEVKQEDVNRDSAFMSSAKAIGIRPTRLSKYCIGMIRKDPKLKYNLFKPKLLIIDRLSHGVS